MARKLLSNVDIFGSIGSDSIFSSFETDKTGTLHQDNVISSRSYRPGREQVKFVQECPSGLITLHEFRKYFCDCTVGNQSSEYAEQIFRTLDNNGDGIVDFREYVTAISMLANGTPEDKLKWSFKLYDKDNDGAITRSEMLEIMEAVYKMSLAASITKVNPLTAEECTNRIFIRLDRDQNAVISLQEFVDGSLDDKWVREMLECDLRTVEVQKPSPKCICLHSRSSRQSMYSSNHAHHT